jgi:hypothetical protein
MKDVPENLDTEVMFTSRRFFSSIELFPLVDKL